MANADGLRLKLRQRSEAVAERAASLAETAVEKAAPARSSPSSVGPQTIRRQRLSGAPRIAWSIEATSPQSEFTEKGTAPHVIRPRRIGGVLVFVTDGETVFARHVNHPGTPPRPWFSPTLKGWGSFLRQAAQQVR